VSGSPTTQVVCEARQHGHVSAVITVGIWVRFNNALAYWLLVQVCNRARRVSSAAKSCSEVPVPLTAAAESERSARGRASTCRDTDQPRIVFKRSRSYNNEQRDQLAASK
jgi:hypothetical protein